MSATITVTTRVETPTPTRTDVADGIDYSAEIQITDEIGEKHRWVGAVTFAPDHVNGGLVPVGDSIDCWMTAPLVKAIETPWVAAHPALVKAIVKSLRGGAGVETFEIESSE